MDAYYYFTLLSLVCRVSITEQWMHTIILL